jgi:rare lipoprotein A
MKRVFSGAAALLLSILGANSASADNWADNFANVHRDGRIVGESERAETRRGTPSRRSNLGAMTADDDDGRPGVRERRASRTATDSAKPRTARYAKTERTATRSSRRTRQTVAHSGAGGSSVVASYYWQPQRVASGGWFNPSAMTAAHKTLPFGTKVRVTNVNNGRSAVVTINDRGPYIAGRVIDLSRAAAGAVGMIANGLARVRMEILGR